MFIIIITPPPPSPSPPTSTPGSRRSPGPAMDTPRPGRGPVHRGPGMVPCAVARAASPGPRRGPQAPGPERGRVAPCARSVRRVAPSGKKPPVQCCPDPSARAGCARAPPLPAFKILKAQTGCGCLRYKNTGIGGACGMPAGCLRDACGCLRYKNTSIGGACGCLRSKTPASVVPAEACGTQKRRHRRCLRMPPVQQRRHRRSLRLPAVQKMQASAVPTGACGTSNAGIGGACGCLRCKKQRRRPRCLRMPAVRKAQAPTVPAGCLRGACGCLRYKNAGTGGACGCLR